MNDVINLIKDVIIQYNLLTNVAITRARFKHWLGYYESILTTLKQEAQLPHKDCVMRCVSKFMLCFTSYGSSEGFKPQKSKSDLQRHWRYSIGHSLSLPLQLCLSCIYLCPL